MSWLRSLIVMVLFVFVAGFAFAEEKVGIHYMSEYGKKINKHCGWTDKSDSECFAWTPPGGQRESAEVVADMKDYTEGKMSYCFTLKNGWSRWILQMKKGRTVDYSKYDRVAFYLQSEHAEDFKDFMVIIESPGKAYKAKFTDLGFKPDGNWHRCEIKVSDIAAAGVDTTNITKLFQVAWGGGVSNGNKFWLDDLHLESGVSGAPKMIPSKNKKVKKPLHSGVNPFADMSGFKLVWSDEFNKDGEPDPKNWSFEEGFKRNNEHQWYQKENAKCKDGMLVIEARKESKPNSNYDASSNHWQKNRKMVEYTSASLTSQGKQSFKYGRFEIRAKIDTRIGMWPAIWTLGNKGDWPSNGEIDIMEYYSGKILANFVWGTHKAWHGEWDGAKISMKKLGKGWEDKFHIWRMDWTEKRIKLYVDDILVNDVELKDTNNATDKFGGPKNPFKQKHYILLNLALGGDNGGDPNKSKWPGQFIVDYVRVYQKKK